MGVPVAELQARVSSREFAEWMAFSYIEPFGETRMDARFAQVLALMANYMRKPGAALAKVADFMPDFDGTRKQAPADMEAQFMGWAKIHNARTEASRT